MKLLFHFCISTKVQGRRETGTKTFALKIQSHIAYACLFSLFGLQFCAQAYSVHYNHAS